MKKSSKYSRKLQTPHNFLNMDEVSESSCHDLGGSNCEGWLWFKAKEFLARWSVLKDYALHLYVNSTAKEVDVIIQILNSRIRPLKKSKSNNCYFQIISDDVTYLFGTKSHSDFCKWLNKLTISTTYILITEKDELISGFSSSFKFEAKHTMISNGTTSNHDKTLNNIDKWKNQRKLSSSSDCIFEQSPNKVDSQVKILFCKSSDNNTPQPCVPQRKYQAKRNKSINYETKNLTKSNFENQVSLDVTTADKLNPKKLPIKIDICSKPQSLKCKEPDIPKLLCKSTSNLVTSIPISKTKKLSVSTSNMLESKSRDPKSPSYYMDANKEIVSIKRLIRDKELLLKEIDQVLKSLHMNDTISQFWDEHGEQILDIASRY